VYVKIVTGVQHQYQMNSDLYWGSKAFCILERNLLMKEV